MNKKFDRELVLKIREFFFLGGNTIFFTFKPGLKLGIIEIFSKNVFFQKHNQRVMGSILDFTQLFLKFSKMI